jgi:D-lactate dehydrogenase
MALLYFYDSTELDRSQISDGLKNTDHTWKFVEDKISLENLDSEAEVISVFVTSTVTREMIEKLPKLKLIACRSTGFNNIDFEATEERDITVVNVPTYGESTVAEYAFTLLLSLVRNMKEVLRPDTSQLDQASMVGQDLIGKTMGVIGTGHIGQYSLRIAKGFSMNVIAYDAFPRNELQEELGFTYTSLEELLEQSDFISIHAPYLPDTHHLINKERLAAMKKGAVLINTARGEIVDTGALVDSLTSGHLGGAAIDVIEGEVLLNHHEETALLRSEIIPEELMRHSIEISLLKKLPNVIVSPHNAFNTLEAVQRINSTSAQNIIDFWYGNVPNKVKAMKKPSGKLIISRHAESEWNAEGKWTGTTDIHLSEKGFRESARLGQLLKNMGVKVDIAYCSQQIRTRETLEGILDASQMFNVDIVREPAINERDYGDYTGKNKWEMQKIIGEEAFNNLRRGWDVEVPGGETLKDVYDRVIPFYTQTVLPALNSGKNVLLVAHGNSIRALMKYIESISDEDVSNLEMLFGQLLVYDVDIEGRSSSKRIESVSFEPSKA